MPGICGFYSCLAQTDAHAITRNMLAALRGTDCRIVSEYVDKHGYFGLGRVSRGLRPTAPQPASLRDGQLLAVMDGELDRMDQHCYDLQLQGRRIFLDDHAAALLACYANKGLDGLADLSGRFVAAVLNLDEKSMTLINDESNTQPIYYAHTSTRFSFASSLPSVSASASVAAEANSNGQHHNGSVNGSAIQTLLPGASLVFHAGQNHVVVNAWRRAQIA